jgi:anthranilate phosphoribosyltransferase
MKDLLNKLIEHQTFSFKEAKSIIYAIAEEQINEYQLTALIVGLQLRGLNLEEIKGFREALLELSLKVDLDGSNAIDLCGTGGDGKNTFNISTTSSFVLAAMGYKVIKHGNYGVSSQCGSSNVLEHVGIHFSNDSKTLNQQLESDNICFLHAPLFHPTLKKVGTVRKYLGIRTLFNALGPLVNPVQPAYQLTGTYNLELAKIYQYILKPERKEYRVVYAMDGYDELTLTENTRILGGREDTLIHANQFKLEALSAGSITSGKTVAKSAEILKDILNGKGSSAQNQVVAANTALAMQCYLPSEKVPDLFKESLAFIESGEAGKKFKFN